MTITEAIIENIENLIAKINEELSELKSILDDAPSDKEMFEDYVTLGVNFAAKGGSYTLHSGKAPSEFVLRRMSDWRTYGRYKTFDEVVEALPKYLADEFDIPVGKAIIHSTLRVNGNEIRGSLSVFAPKNEKTQEQTFSLLISDGLRWKNYTSQFTSNPSLLFMDSVTNPQEVLDVLDRVPNADYFDLTLTNISDFSTEDIQEIVNKLSTIPFKNKPNRRVFLYGPTAILSPVDYTELEKSWKVFFL